MKTLNDLLGSLFVSYLFVCLLIGVQAEQQPIYAQDRARPLPLSTNEVKGTLRPGVRSETFYVLEARSSLDFTLSVTSYQDWAMLSVSVLDKDFAPLLQFDASSATPNGTEKRDARLRIDGRQVIVLKLTTPSANKSGAFTLKIKGEIAPAQLPAPNQPVVAATQPAARETTPPPLNTPSLGTAPNTKAETVTPMPAAPEVTILRQPVAMPAAPLSSEKKAESLGNTVSSAIKEIGTEKRFALIIGNSAYETLPLKNPVNDARAMADALVNCGFEVTMVENGNKRRMEESIRTFGSKLDAKSAGLFYFAGHGLQVNGTNYLVPLGARIEKEADIEYETVDVGRVLAEFATARSALSIVILDACRDNPFATATRSLTRGLAVVRLPKDAAGTLVAYATSPGNVARDGSGKNGLYTEELLRNLLTPGLKLEEVFKLTRIGVKERSNGTQVPWENSSIDGDFYFKRRQ